MFIPSAQGAPASTDSFAPSSTPPTNGNTETVRHMLFGSLSAVQSTIRLLHQLNYAEPNDWSQPISTGRSNEVMVILTKRLKLSPRS